METALTGYYLFDKAKQSTITSTTLDSSGNGRDLTENGFAGDNSEYVVGILDHAVALNGSSKYLTASANTVHNITTGDFTITGWIYRTTDSGGFETVVAKLTGTNVGYIIDILDTNDTLRFLIGDGTDTVFPASSTAIAVNTWYFFACVADRDGNATVYLNGVQNGTPSAMSAVDSITNTQTFTVGRASSGSVSFFPGRIDDLRIYNTALSATEVSDLYNKALITISKNNGASYYEARNFEGLQMSMVNPVDAIANILGDEDDTILLQMFGPSLQMAFDWILTSEPTTVVYGTGGTVTTAQGQQIYLMDTLTPKGTAALTDTYTLTIYYGAGVSFVRTGRPQKIDIATTPQESLTFRAHFDFIVGTVS